LYIYDGCSKNKFTKKSHSINSQSTENPKSTFSGKFYSEHNYVQIFLDDDIIIVTPYVNRTQCICALFSAPVICHISQVINSIGKGKTNNFNKLTSRL